MPRPLTGARRALTASLLLGLTLAACGGDSTGNTKTTILFGGVFAGEDGTEAGSFNVTVVPADSTGTGSFVVNGDRKTFSTLSYDGTSFAASGAGFVFTGAADDSTVTGSYTSANGGGIFTGLKKLGSVAPISYCGSHIGARNGVPLAGPFAFVERSGTRRGVFTSVLGDGFRGVLRAANSSGPVTLDTLTGTALVAVAGSNFTGAYLMASGDSGAASGAVCRATVTTPISSQVQGVLGSFTGDTVGRFVFVLSSTGIGSTGAYRMADSAALTAGTHNFLAVVSGVNSQVAAFDSTFRFIITLDTGIVEGNYARGGSVGGSLAGIFNNGALLPSLCGSESGQANGGGALGGAFAFILRPDSSVFGLFTGGFGSTFAGTVSGKASSTPLAFMEGFGEPAVLIADTNSFSGVYNFTAGPSGSLQGGRCP